MLYDPADSQYTQTNKILGRLNYKIFSKITENNDKYIIQLMSKIFEKVFAFLYITIRTTFYDSFNFFFFTIGIFASKIHTSEPKIYPVLLKFV